MLELILSLGKKVLRKLRFCFWKIRLLMHKPRRLKNIIVFESVPDVADNTKAVFDEMLRRGINNDYKLVWLLFGSDRRNYPKLTNVYYIPCEDAKAQYFSKLAKVKICCNNFLTKDCEEQLCVYLSHGTTIKHIRGYYTIPDEIDCVLAASEGVVDLQAYEFNFDKNKIVPLGFPRNDVFCKKPVEIHNILNTQCKKIIVWYPTFRQHRFGGKTGSNNALPIIHNDFFAKALNDVAKQEDVLIVLKPHFAQDIGYIKKMNLSNIRFIDDSLFVNYNIRSYEFVGACDALITDYSSIYFDYLLCNKPIAAVWEDIEGYKTNPGLVKDYDYLMKGAEKIYTIDDLKEFVVRVSKDVDLLKSEREEIRDYANFSTDGQNSKRVVDFILNKLK